MDKAQFNHRLRSINDGNLESLNQIKQFDSILDTVNSIKIIICCSNACNKLLSTKTFPKNLEECLKYLISFIRAPNESNITQYYQAVYHILLLAKESNNVIFLLNIEPILFPPSFVTKLTEKQKKYCLASVNLLFNLMLEISKNSNCPEKVYVIDIARFAICLYRRVLDDESFLEKAQLCLQCLDSAKVNFNLLASFFCYIFEILDKNISLNDNNLKIIISLIEIIIVSAINSKNFKNFEETYRNIGKHFKAMKTEWLYVYDLLKSLVYLMPDTQKTPELFKASCKNLQKIYKLFWTRNITYFNTLCMKIRQISSMMVSFYRKNEMSWIEMEESIQINIFNFLFECATLCKISCNCGCKPSNIQFASNLVLHIFKLIDIHIKRTPMSEYYRKNTSIYLKYLRNNNFIDVCKTCNVCKEFWHKELLLYIFNIATHMRKLNDNNSPEYLQYLVEGFLSMELQENETNLLKQVLSTLTQVLIDKEQYEPCMAIASLCFYVFNNESEGTINRWIFSKTNLKDNEDIQQITFTTAFKKFEKILKPYIGYIKLDKNKKIELLKLELDSYKQKWKSKFPMMTVLKEIIEIADISTVIDVILNIYGDCTLHIHTDTLTLIYKAMLKYKTEMKQDIDSKVNLSNMYYLYYYYNSKEEIVQNFEEIEKSNMVQAAIDKENSNDDPNERCDVVTSYKSLKLDKSASCLSYLNKSLAILLEIYGENKIKSKDYKTVHCLLMNIFSEYRLQLHSVASLQALQLAYKLSAEENNSLNSLKCITYLIENADVTKEYIVDLISKADENCSSIKEEEYFEDLLLYYIIKSRAYFYHDQEKSFSVFEKADCLYKKFDSKLSKILIVQLMFLKYKLEVARGNGNESSAFGSLLMSFYKMEKDNLLKENAQIKATKFEVYEELVKYFYNKKMPKQIRCFAKWPLKLSQEMVLPLRSVQFLYYLSYSDLITCKYDDCNVKLKGISDALCFNNNDCLNKTKDDEIDEIIKKIKDFNLDEIKSVECKEIETTSCQCCNCSWPEIHMYALKLRRLNILMSLYKNKLGVCKENLKEAILFYKTSCFKSVSVNSDLTLNLYDTILEAYYCIILDYCDYLYQINNKRLAMETNVGVLKELSKRKLKFSNLFQKALFLRLNYLNQMTLDSKIVTNVVQIEIEVPSIDGNLQKTPETKCSKVSICNVSPCSPLMPQKRMPKPVALNLSENSEDERPLKSNKNLFETAKPNITKEATVMSLSQDDSDTENKQTKTRRVKKPIDKTVDNKLKNKTKLLTNRLRLASNNENLNSKILKVPEILLNGVEVKNEVAETRRSTRRKQ